MIAGFLELPGVASGEDGCPGGCTFGVGCEGVVEEDAFFSNTIKSRGVDPLTAIGTCMRPGLIVGDAEENVWAFAHREISCLIFW